MKINVFRAKETIHIVMITKDSFTDIALSKDEAETAVCGLSESLKAIKCNKIKKRANEISGI